jgi:hypothetical protein
MPLDSIADRLEQVWLYLLLPLWLLAGFGDWCCHRVQRIERSAGLKESLMHLLMLAELGGGLLAALLLETNAAALLLLLAACLAHELTTWWDLVYADSKRHIPVAEQWVHSLQLVLPWAALATLAVLHWPQIMSPDWTLRWRPPPLPAGYLMALGTAGLLLAALPFAEEAWRCARARHGP